MISRGTVPGLCLAALVSGCDRLDLTAAAPSPLDIGQRFASAGAALPDTTVIDVADYTYAPNYVSVKPGGTVQWHFRGPKGHSVEDVSGLNQYSSGYARAGVVFHHTFTAAGSYSFHCDPHPLAMTGRVEVPLVIEPSFAAAGVPVSIKWASDTSPSGYVYDIQIKDPGATAFRDWRVGQKTASISAALSRVGLFRFRARLRHLSDGKYSGWSPETPLTIGSTANGTTTDFRLHCSGWKCTFTDASYSSASFSSWQWRFGDGGTGATQNGDHTYLSDATVNLQLTATSAAGAQTYARNFRPTNLKARSVVAFTCAGLTCSFADSSFDVDGSIVSWSWTFGDGQSSTLQNPVHVYSGDGNYNVGLVATDNGGLVGVLDTLFVNLQAGNTGPVSKFTYVCNRLACTFTDLSYDTDGSVTGWSWDFGDDAKSTAQNPTHTFFAPGDYTVSLRATDNAGLQASPFRKTLKLQ